MTFPAPFIEAKDTQSKGYDSGGQKILTSGAKCSIKAPPLCKNNPNPAQPPVPPYLPCCFSGHSPWQSTNDTMLIGGKPTLTQDSKCTCMSKGGTISCKIPSYAAPTFKIETGASVGGVADIAAIVTTDSTAKASKSSDSTAQTKNTAPIAPLVVINLGGSKTDNQTVGEETEKTGTQAVEKKEIPEKEYMLCDYKNCENVTTCDYYNTDLTVYNKSSELKGNYKKEFPSDYTAYEERASQALEQLNPHGFTKAAHHLVSGNQCFLAVKKKEDEETNSEKEPLLFGKLVRLSIFFGYDINNGTNCILLPTQNDKSQRTEDKQLHAAAYSVMSAMGAQWHVGGHSYSISNKTLEHMKAYYTRYPQLYVSTGTPNYFEDYATMVIKSLEKLQTRKYMKRQCPMKNKEKKAVKFNENLNNLSQEIKGYLDQFEKNPKNSFPYFVSKEAVSYAFDLPSTVKIILLTPSSQGYTAEKFRLERYLSNDSQLNPKHRGSHIVEKTKAFVKFCEDIIFFVGGSISDLGFHHGVHPISLPTSWDGTEALELYLKSHENILLSKIGMYKNNHFNPNGVQSKRAQELEGASDT